MTLFVIDLSQHHTKLLVLMAVFVHAFRRDGLSL